MQQFTGQEYLKIDIANNFGREQNGNSLDKQTWNQRIAWFDDNEPRLMELLQFAEEPALYYAGVQAWLATKNGKPSGYPVSLDATSSGLQLLSVLTGDRMAASICNVIDTGKREDAYTNIYHGMVAKMQGLAGNIKREDTKRSIMTSLYGSRAVPKEVFGEGQQLRVFYETMEEMAPAAWELNEMFLDIWNPQATEYRWVLPDNFHVNIKVMAYESEIVHFLNEPYEVSYMVNKPIEEGRSLGANCIHSLDGMIVREITRRCDYNPDSVLRVTEALISKELGGQGMGRKNDVLVETLWKRYLASGYLSARILDELDLSNMGLVDKKVIWELVNSLPKKPFQVISVHDCFRVLPNYGNDLRWQYNNQLMLIAKSTLLEDLMSQITGHQVHLGKLDPSLWKDVLGTNYALS